MCCPVCFYEELLVVLFSEMSQIDTENDKKPKNFPIFRDFMHLSIFLIDFVNWTVQKSRQGKTVLSRMLRKEINGVFQTKTVQN